MRSSTVTLFYSDEMDASNAMVRWRNCNPAAYWLLTIISEGANAGKWMVYMADRWHKPLERPDDE